MFVTPNIGTVREKFGHIFHQMCSLELVDTYSFLGWFGSNVLQVPYASFSVFVCFFGGGCGTILVHFQLRSCRFTKSCSRGTSVCCLWELFRLLDLLGPSVPKMEPPYWKDW